MTQQISRHTPVRRERWNMRPVQSDQSYQPAPGSVMTVALRPQAPSLPNLTNGSLNCHNSAKNLPNHDKYCQLLTVCIISLNESPSMQAIGTWRFEAFHDLHYNHKCDREPPKRVFFLPLAANWPPV